MSRVNLIEQLYVKRKSALGFDFDGLRGPTVSSIFAPQDIELLYNVATSIRYSANIDKKYKEIDELMKRRGFYKAHCGTNRAVYNCYEDRSFVVKVAVDKVALRDTPAEFKNQQLIKPFCCKIFDVHPSGVVGTIERVNPITSLEEFQSVAPDIFNMMITKIIGKYVVDDLGADKYMNYGVRQYSNGFTFGPVILDFPYVYELDGAKLICQKPINTPMGLMPCGGDIDYDESLSHLICRKCGRAYKAIDLENKSNKNVLIMYGDNNGGKIMRTKIVNRKTGKVVLDTGVSSKTVMTKEQFNNLPKMDDGDLSAKIVAKKKFTKYAPIKQAKQDYYTKLQVDFHNQMEEKRFSEETPEKKKVIVVNSHKSNMTNVATQETAERHLVINKTARVVVEEPVEEKVVTMDEEAETSYEVEEPMAVQEETIVEVEEETVKVSETIEMVSETTVDEEVETHEPKAEEEADNYAAEEDSEADEEASSETEAVETEDEPQINYELLSFDDNEDGSEHNEEPVIDNSIKEGTVIEEQTDLWQGYDYQSYMETSGKNQRQKRRESNKNKKYSKHSGKKGKNYNRYDDDDIDNY